MKNPQTDTKVEEPEQDLLGRLEDLPPAALRERVAKVEGLSKDDEENHSRWLKSNRRRAINKLSSWFLHFLFFVTCGIVLFVVGGTIWLTFSWITSFINDPTKVGSLLGRLWEIGLVALATLFIQSAWPKD